MKFFYARLRSALSFKYIVYFLSEKNNLFANFSVGYFLIEIFEHICAPLEALLFKCLTVFAKHRYHKLQTGLFVRKIGASYRQFCFIRDTEADIF